MIINNIQSNLLEHLGYFGYLTVSHQRLFTGKSLGYLREQLAILTQRGYVQSFHIEVAQKRTENMYSLTKEGKEILLQHEKVFSHIRVPASYKPVIVLDYNHRRNYLFLVIAATMMLRKLGIAIPVFHSYFDFVGDNRTKKNGALQSKTKIPLNNNTAFAPDGIIVTDKAGKKTMFLLEMCNGRDAARVVNQLYNKHRIAISNGEPGTTLGIPANPFVFSCFEYDGCRQAVINKLLQIPTFASMSKLFFFGSLDDVIKDFSGAWHTIHGEPFLFDQIL